MDNTSWIKFKINSNILDYDKFHTSQSNISESRIEERTHPCVLSILIDKGENSME